MTETYSLALTALRADSQFTPKLLTMPDSAGRDGAGIQYNTRLGNQILCKLPDGSQAWYTIDAERSTPANPVLLKV